MISFINFLQKHHLDVSTLVNLFVAVVSKLAYSQLLSDLAANVSVCKLSHMLHRAQLFSILATNIPNLFLLVIR